MPHFDSAHDYGRFQQSVKTKARYFRTKQAEEFLRALSESAKGRYLTFFEGNTLWRAQLGHWWSPVVDEDGNEIVGADEPGPHGPRRMKPLVGQASEGRANSKGIPCLYLSTQQDTALSETRPWLGMSISIAQFAAVRDLKLVGFVFDTPPELRYLGFRGSEPPPEKRDEVVWYRIGSAFSEPINPTDTSADYAPTQIIAEMFKSEGLDGLAYRSGFAGGYNVALFDIESARQVNCFLFETKNLNFEFEEDASARPYFLRSKEPEDDT